MTRKEFIEFKHWDVSNYKEYIKNFFNVEWCSEHLEGSICLYELLADRPFYKVNQEYTKQYNKNRDVGSTYDWLEQTATDEDVKNYLRK